MRRADLDDFECHQSKQRLAVLPPGNTSCEDTPIMGKQYIYTIANLTKKHGTKEVLKDIWLAFFPGAKIGVLGRNGAGKSTLLRIMAGEDTAIRRRSTADRRLHPRLSAARTAAQRSTGCVGQFTGGHSPAPSSGGPIQ